MRTAIITTTLLATLVFAANAAAEPNYDTQHKQKGIDPTQTDTDTTLPNDEATGASSTTPTGQTKTTAALYGAGTERQPNADRGERDERRPNRWMLFTGGTIFLGTYAASAIAGGLSDTNGDENLFIPIVGPWMDIAERDCKLGECTLREDVNIAHVIGSGAAQATGLAIMIGSFFVGERRDGRPTPQPAVPSAKVHVLPINIRGGGGIGAVGTF